MVMRWRWWGRRRVEGECSKERDRAFDLGLLRVDVMMKKKSICSWKGASEGSPEDRQTRKEVKRAAAAGTNRKCWFDSPNLSEGVSPTPVACCSSLNSHTQSQSHAPALLSPDSRWVQPGPAHKSSNHTSVLCTPELHSCMEFWCARFCAECLGPPLLHRTAFCHGSMAVVRSQSSVARGFVA